MQPHRQYSENGLHRTLFVVKLKHTNDGMDCLKCGLNAQQST